MVVQGIPCLEKAVRMETVSAGDWDKWLDEALLWSLCALCNGSEKPSLGVGSRCGETRAMDMG